MATVAFIGPDGAGKTTQTRMLRESGVVPFKYLYMGVDIPASNIALPTSRLIERFKSRSSRVTAVAPPATDGTRPARASRSVGASLRGYARLANRLSEEWFRQLVSWTYQARGYSVLYDRHFALDFAPEIVPPGDQPLDKRIHSWCLRHLYPAPHLVIFLDAPGTLLFARKGELSIDELERRRQGFLALGKRIPGFVRVDATQPLPDVYAEITRHVLRVCGKRGDRRVEESAR
jgi:thymidylate kinase